MTTDPYQTLDVARTATRDQIKRRYRELAKALHPDLNPGQPAIAERFKRITAAYHLLADPLQRARFDRGEIDADGQWPSDPEWARDDSFARRFATREGQDDDESLLDFFAELFGADDYPVRARGADVTLPLAVDFLEAAKGVDKQITTGTGVTFAVTVPAGVHDGQMLRVKGQGRPGHGGAPAGDAYVEVTVRPHRHFRLEDRDVHLDLPVNLAEAILGARIDVPTIDGPIGLRLPAGSNQGTVIQLAERGMVDPRTNKRGDQYVHLQVALPRTIDRELQTFIRRWSKAHPYDPRRDLEGGGDSED